MNFEFVKPQQPKNLERESHGSIQSLFLNYIWDGQLSQFQPHKYLIRSRKKKFNQNQTAQQKHSQNQSTPIIQDYTPQKQLNNSSFIVFVTLKSQIVPILKLIMKLKYLILLGLITSILCALRYHDQDMLKSHHNHHFSTDTPITVYLMPHSHDDVGWLKTVDNYFYGGDQATQWAGVQYTIDSVVTELSLNPSYKFSIVQMAFLYRWWNNANQTQKDLIKKHINSEQIQIINGGWCMHDQATTYYQDIIDQMTAGLNWAKNTFGVVPTIGWHIDPFGHQSSNAAIFSQLGFNAWFFSRIDYQDKQIRLSKKAFEMIWHPTQYSGNDNYIFTHLNYYHYSPPPGFCYDSLCKDVPIKDDPTLQDYNIDERSRNLSNYFKSMASHFRSSNLFHTLGEDFHFSNPRMWFINFDKLIKYINSNSSFGVTLKYATPGEYIKAINKQNNVYPTKYDDFYPYADQIHGYWTGYFTSRVSIKSMVKEFGRYLQSVRTHISLLKISNLSNYINANPDKIESAIWEMEMASGILQHHDAVAGTEKQKVANDYVMIASRAYTSLHKVYDEIRKQTIKRQIGEYPNAIFNTLWNTTYQQWGISSNLSSGNSVLLHLYNPGPAGNYMIRIKVDNSASFMSITNTNGSAISGDLICSNSANAKDCDLIFNIYINETSYSYVKLKKQNAGGSVKVIPFETVSSIAITKTFTITQSTKMTFTRSMSKMQVTTGNKTFSIIPGYSYYESYQDEGQKSGAYIFRPSQATINGSKRYSIFKNYHYAEGDSVTVFVYEGDKTYTKIFFSKIQNEIQSKGFQMQTFVNSIDVSDGQGKQVVMTLSHSLNNNKTFYTDSNGLQQQKRVTNFRPTWTLSVNEPISGNYYPINSHISVVGNDSSKLSVVVDRSEGGTACKDGFIQLMINRRTLRDDARGVDEPLNQTDDKGNGLTQKIRHWVVYGNSTRERQKSNDQSIVVTWSNTNSDGFSQFSASGSVFPVPNDVKLYLRPHSNGTYLLRMHNFNVQSARTVMIPDGWKVDETTLGGNQLLSQWKAKQMKWKEEPYTISDQQMQSNRVTSSLKKQRDSGDALSIKPFEIRTFLLKQQ